ncbi:MAG: SUMF1/EgtB/PvdO family nonheme iron enzyme, partial [Bacteroidota bacterium]
LEISVSAIEMVYVPSGGFYLGDGANDFGQFEAGISGEPYFVASEAQLTLGGGSPLSVGNNHTINMLNDDDFDDVTSRTLPAEFPKGTEAFYCMKYEVSQAQYASFIEHITNDQKVDRDGPYYVNATNVFPVKDGTGWAEADYPARAMHYISWPDAAAYLDWSGLRPLSEFEFEKACRGPKEPVNDELAWGHSDWYINGLYTILNEGTEQEMIADLGENIGNGNTQSIYSGYPSPLRCGIFAASAKNKTREETGATYWGIMEMSGNCYEFVISVGSSQTRDFRGLHGDGNITSTGNASFSLLSDWAFVNSVGVGYRSSEISTRYGGNYNNPNRELWHGIRGVRTASN